MNHWLLVPVLLPLMCGALLMTSSRSRFEPDAIGQCC